MPFKIYNLYYCENCMKNAHEKVKMKLERVWFEDWEKKLLVCPICGSTKEYA